jgi:DNA-binding NtrC family response regulator
MQPLSILIADDEESIRLLVQRLLAGAGHTVVCAADGKEAREAVKRHRFDLVITDVLMPDGDGLDLIADLKRAQPTARVLAISGGGRYVDGDDCLKMARGLGAHAAMMKPFDWKALQAGIEQALGGKTGPSPAASI